MVYFLKVKGPDWACIFLEENRCTIHAVNPRACRTYPFAVNPEDGTFLVAQDYPHHFQNKAVRAKNWTKRRMTQEDWEYMALDYSSAIQIARLLKQIPDEERSRAMVLFLHYRYSAYDLDQPFLQQYRHNQTQLIQALSQLAQTSQSQ